MTDKVAPESTKFPKPIFGTNVTEYPADFLAKREAAKEEFVTLKDGRKICYITIGDGDADNMPVICMHGGTESKWVWLQKSDLPGITLIAIDRPGYGNLIGKSYVGI